MAHPRAVICGLCGGKFFKASLPFHQKVCAKKHEYIDIPCQFCDIPVPRKEMEDHLRVCAVAKKHRRSKNKQAQGYPPRSTQIRTSLPHLPTPGSSRAGSSGGGDASSRRRPSSNDGGGGGGERGAAAAAGDGRGRCAVCGRGFALERLARHQAVCRKAHRRRRKPIIFDSQKQRVGGTEAANYIRESSRPRLLGGRTIDGANGSSGAAGRAGWHANWRARHRDFQRMIHAARTSNVPEYLAEPRTTLYNKQRSLPSNREARSLIGAEPSSPGDRLVPCKYCQRTFAEDTARRHIPKCARTLNRPAPPRYRLHAFEYGGGGGPSSDGRHLTAAAATAPAPAAAERGRRRAAALASPISMERRRPGPQRRRRQQRAAEPRDGGGGAGLPAGQHQRGPGKLPLSLTAAEGEEAVKLFFSMTSKSHDLGGSHKQPQQLRSRKTIKEGLEEMKALESCSFYPPQDLLNFQDKSIAGAVFSDKINRRKTQPVHRSSLPPTTNKYPTTMMMTSDKNGFSSTAYTAAARKQLPPPANGKKEAADREVVAATGGLTKQRSVEYIIRTGGASSSSGVPQHLRIHSRRQKVAEESQEKGEAIAHHRSSSTRRMMT